MLSGCCCFFVDRHVPFWRFADRVPVVVPVVSEKDPSREEKEEEESSGGGGGAVRKQGRRKDDGSVLDHCVAL